jgi:hypothetical protein
MGVDFISGELETSKQSIPTFDHTRISSNMLKMDSKSGSSTFNGERNPFLSSMGESSR